MVLFGAERHRLLTTLFEQVWQDDGTIVVVKPRGAFVPVLPSRMPNHQGSVCKQRCPEWERRGSNTRSAPHRDTDERRGG